MYAHLEEEEGAALPPEEPSVPPRQWIRKNLFSSISNTLLTLAFGVVVIFAVRGLLRFVFGDERRWDAVSTNLRLLFAQGYPLDQFVRIWVSVGVLLVLTGLSLAIFRVSGSLSMKRIAIWAMNLGAFALIVAVLAPLSGGGRVGWLVAGFVLFGIGAGIWYGLGEAKRRSTFVPTVWVSFGFLGLIVLSLWVVPYGHYYSVDGRAVAETGRTVAFSTQMPWTVMWVLLVGSYVLGVAVRDKLFPAAKSLLVALWFLSPFVITWIILRDPEFEYDHVFSTDIPMALGFAVLGGALLYFLTKPDLGELGRVIAVALLGFAFFNWVAAFFGWYPMLQKARISFLLLGLAALIAPSFAGDRKRRLRFVYMWAGSMAVFHWLLTAINSDSTLTIQTDTFFGGFTLTVFVATLTMLFSFPIGVMLALARTSTLPIFRVLSTIYIEMVRGVPLITILFFFSTILPLFLPAGMGVTELAAIIVGYTLFSAAYTAENVRGGLQSIRRGQYEAADALGLNTGQRTGFIVMPQALRVSIPPLVGSAIGTFKETSLVAIIGSFDLLLIANSTIGGQTDFIGVKREGLLFVSAVYWVVAFSMSKYSQRLERKLGVGER
jgi:His/Glu/Gln/Arg/opine family amino acid ABC transporter permease subunit